MEMGKEEWEMGEEEWEMGQEEWEMECNRKGNGRRGIGNGM